MDKDISSFAVDPDILSDGVQRRKRTSSIISFETALTITIDSNFVIDNVEDLCAARKDFHQRGDHFSNLCLCIPSSMKCIYLMLNSERDF